jgi:hypothetical protein
MAKARLILLGILAALATSAMAAASASAHEFIVGGTGIKEVLKGTFTSGTSTLKGEVLSKKIAIVSSLDTGTFSIGPAGTSTFEVSFTKDTISEVGSKGELIALPKCVVPTITFSGTDALLELKSKLLDTFTGSAPPLFVKIKVNNLSETETCALKGTYEADGTANAFLPSVGTPAKTHKIEFNPIEESQSLTLGGKPATFESIETLALNDGAEWSAK